MGSGTGGHAKFFARHGFNILGIDKSERMVDEARKKTHKSHGSKISFELGDVRDFLKKIKNMML